MTARRDTAFRKTAFCRAAAILAALICAIGGIAGADTKKETTGLQAAAAPRAGDTEIRILWLEEAHDYLRVNVFSGEEELMEKAVLEDDVLVLFLLRSLEEGETVTVFLSEAKGEAPRTLELIVEAAYNHALAAMEARLPAMTAAWQEIFQPLLTEGRFFLPLNWTDLPFHFFPDEAPNLKVLEGADGISASLDGALPPGWRVAVGLGIPVEMTDCIYDEAEQCWKASGLFEAVYLIREGIPDGYSIEIAYRKSTGYLADYPVLLFSRESETGTESFADYGWGTVRDFQGSMFALVLNDESYYAEYGMDHCLSQYYDLRYGLTFSPADELLEGELPEGYVCRVVHSLEK